MPAGGLADGRLAHPGRQQQIGPHRFLPRASRHRLDRPSEQAPARVRVRPGGGRRLRLRHSRGEPREHVVALVLLGREIELELCAEREAGAIREEVTNRGPFRPARPAELRHVRDDGIVQRKPACLGEPGNDRRNHRLRERAGAEAALRRHRCARSHVRDAGEREGLDALPEDADRRAGHPMRARMLTEEVGELPLVHASTACPLITSPPSRRSRGRATPPGRQAPPGRPSRWLG